ncbi:DUF1835 domain-containing protein [Paenibacillus sp. GYB003]|uniref:DUF1835 domain-containing protein n=1 Tax=Paenibacillus sp. GYB003 TaxID=2994392 RepID=UPI002F96BEF8
MNSFLTHIRDLAPGEIGSILAELFRLMELESAGGDDGRRKLAEQAVQLCSDRLQEARQRMLEAEASQSDIHVVFSLSDAGLLKVTLNELGMRHKSRVLAFNDIFSLGPLDRLELEEGRRRRLQWFDERDPRHGYYDLFNRECQIKNVKDQLEQIPESKSITIWCANNAHDQTGLRFVLHVLRERKQPVRMLNVSELYEKISAEEPPYALGLTERESFRQIVSRFNHVDPLDSGQRRRLGAEWLELSAQGHTLRLWDEGKIVGAGEEALDDLIMSVISQLQRGETADEYVKGGKVVGHIFHRLRQLVSSAFIEYRIWMLIGEGRLSFKGLPYAMHQYSVRLA